MKELMSLLERFVVAVEALAVAFNSPPAKAVAEKPAAKPAAAKPAAAKPAAGKGSKAKTLDDVREVLSQLEGPQAKGLVASFNATKVSELAKKDYARVIAEAQKILAGSGDEDTETDDGLFD